MAPFKRLLGVLAFFAGTALLNGPSAAATIGINGGVLTIFAESGDDILLIFPASPTALSFVGLSLDILTPGCAGVGFVDCAIFGLTEVRINMLGGDDIVDMSSVPAIPGLTFIVVGREGDDILLGGASATRMYGGAGDDILIAGTGVTCLDGGAGNNVLIGSDCDAGEEPVFPPAQPAGVPEPATWPLLMAALLGATAGRGAHDAMKARKSGA